MFLNFIRNWLVEEPYTSSDTESLFIMHFYAQTIVFLSRS